MLPHKFLVVDDAPAIVESLKATLESLGVPSANIAIAMTAAEAMERFEATEPDVIFMDIQLPDVGGNSVAWHILHKKPRAKVIVMTGMDRTSPAVRQLVSAGAYEVMEKPFHYPKIRDILRMLEEETKGLHRVE